MYGRTINSDGVLGAKKKKRNIMQNTFLIL